jgi:uncharacterized protein (TIGR00251 family)
MKVNRPTIAPHTDAPHTDGVPKSARPPPASACCRWDAGDLILSVKVHPRSKKFQLGRVVGNHLQVKVAAPPENGKATDELLSGLAAALGVRPGAITVIRGAFTPSKILRIAAPRTLPPEMTACAGAPGHK